MDRKNDISEGEEKVKNKNQNNKNGFTLVELLAVIVILAIILVIAVPKVMSVIEDSKKATLESTAKMIASSAEKAKVQNTVLGKTDTITCDSVAKINNLDYDACEIVFEDNTAYVTITGKGKFAGLYVCGGTKTEAEATSESCGTSTGDGDTAVNFITGLLADEETLHNGLVQTTVEHNGTSYNAGIRYVGAMADVKNKVYYNCEDTDSNGVVYGGENYDYANSCEVWRIIGVFDTKTSTSSTAVPRVKLINTASTFKASWDSSDTSINDGKGVTQWGPSGSYEGADLMQLLNGYYIEKNDSNIPEANKKECKYCSGSGQETCENTCDTESATLASQNMKPLTSTALNMIDNAVWDTYATLESTASTAYLQEKGISTQYTGSSECVANGGGDFCNDGIERTTSWTGLVGLMSVSDIGYANGWLYNQSDNSVYPWLISPYAYSDRAYVVWRAYDGRVTSTVARVQSGVFASVYLNSNIQIIGGDGDTEPYKLK